MAQETPGRWRVVRIATSAGEKLYWELVGRDGTVLERIPADFPLARKDAGDDSLPPAPPDAGA